jgi:pyridoxal phosphate enzyme (YggS family)
MIADNLNRIKYGLPPNVKLIVVSKTIPVSKILEAYDTGHRIFGENKVQDLFSKYQKLPKDIEWHMIGHLQSNKVKNIVPFISLIHSVDSSKLLEIINKEGSKTGRVIDCLLQVHIATEETKFGFDETELDNMLKSDIFYTLKNIRIRGLMGMATFTNETLKIKNEFHKLAELLKALKSKYFFQNNYFKELSMGMSSDYLIGIEEGSTMVRLGTSIFGERI